MILSLPFVESHKRPAVSIPDLIEVLAEHLDDLLYGIGIHGTAYDDIGGLEFGGFLLCKAFVCFGI